MELAARMQRGELSHGEAERLHLFLDLERLGRSRARVIGSRCTRCAGERPQSSVSARMRLGLTGSTSNWRICSLSTCARWTSTRSPRGEPADAGRLRRAVRITGACASVRECPLRFGASADDHPCAVEPRRSDSRLLGKVRRTDDGLVLSETSVGLFRVRSLRFDSGAVLQRQSVDGITDAASLSPCAHADEETGTVARPHEDVLGPRGTVHEIPAAEPSLFAFDQGKHSPESTRKSSWESSPW
jgi:hypothetical protein